MDVSLVVVFRVTLAAAAAASTRFLGFLPPPSLNFTDSEVVVVCVDVASGSVVCNISDI